MERVDAVVVGQGLAGTGLVWALRRRGFRVVAIDRGEAGTASRVAAGLVTPITGRRLARAWRLDELWPAAEAFYRRAEAETRTEFFHVGPSVRLLASESERAEYEGRAAGAFSGLTGPPDPPVRPDWFDAPHGGFAMAPAARLDVPCYLDASRTRFADGGGYLTGAVEPVDVALTPDGVRLDRFGLVARWLAFCQGIDAAANPWFGGVRLRPVKGEVLTVRVPGLAETRVVHRGVWLAPLGGEAFLVGSTYEHHTADGAPTARGRDEVCERLRAFLRLPFEVIDHRAGRRPVTRDSRPVIGVHPEHPQLAYFNGLGSKGALQAPHLAEQLAARLSGDGEIDPAVGLGRAGVG